MRLSHLVSFGQDARCCVVCVFFLFFDGYSARAQIARLSQKLIRANFRPEHKVPTKSVSRSGYPSKVPLERGGGLRLC